MSQRRTNSPNEVMRKDFKALNNSWSSPQVILKSLIKRLEESGQQPNARVPAASFRPDAREFDAWVFDFPHNGSTLTCAFVSFPTASFTVGHKVEDGVWRDYSAELPTLSLSPAFRSAFEWFVQQGAHEPWEGLDFTTSAVRKGNREFFEFYNARDVDDPVVRPVRG